MADPDSPRPGDDSVLGRQVQSHEAPDWLKRIAPYIVGVPLALLGFGWVYYVPPDTFGSPAYITFSVVVLVAVWSGIGPDPIPGRRWATEGRFARRLVVFGLLAAVIIAGVALNQRVAMFSSFGWGAVAAAAKLVFLMEFAERLAPCPRCEQTRWFIKDAGAFYCGRCGTQLPTGTLG